MKSVTERVLDRVWLGGLVAASVLIYITVAPLILLWTLSIESTPTPTDGPYNVDCIGFRPVSAARLHQDAHGLHVEAISGENYTFTSTSCRVQDNTQ